MKKLFLLQLLILLLTGVQAVLAMEAGKHNEKPSDLVGKREETNKLKGADQLIKALKETGGMEDLLPLIGEFAHWNAQQEFPEVLNPDLEAYFLKISVPNATLKREGPKKVSYSVGSSKTRYTLILDNPWKSPLDRRMERYFRLITEGLRTKHIALLNTIWKNHNEGNPYHLDEADKKKLQLLPQFLQNAMKLPSVESKAKASDWDSTIPYACTLL